MSANGHFTHLLTLFAFTFVVVLCLVDSFLFFFHFLQLGVAMKLLQRKRESIKLQQWSLPSGVRQVYCLLPGLPHWDHLSLLIWMPSFRSLTECWSVLIMLNISGFLMMQRLTSKAIECHKGEFVS